VKTGNSSALPHPHRHGAAKMKKSPYQKYQDKMPGDPQQIFSIFPGSKHPDSKPDAKQGRKIESPQQNRLILSEKR
jgi:hypothetical protein